MPLKYNVDGKFAKQMLMSIGHGGLALIMPFARATSLFPMVYTHQHNIDC